MTLHEVPAVESMQSRGPLMATKTDRNTARLIDVEQELAALRRPSEGCGWFVDVGCSCSRWPDVGKGLVCSGGTLRGDD
jgi:hypothetical protein